MENPSASSPDRMAWLALAVLAIGWGVGPAVPALLQGDLLGHPYTDLYPSVWGLWGFSLAQPGLPNHTDLLGFPEGMGFYYSSPMKGWLATPLLPLLGLPATYDLLTVMARVGTVLAAFAAGRAWGLGPRGAVAAAAVYGTSPFFQGYAVEGIVEGTDGWTLALWAWAVGRRRWTLAVPYFALTLLSSWYLGMCACLLAVLAALSRPGALWSFGGLVLAAPALQQFAGAFPATAPLPDAIRAAMGAPLTIPRPGIGDGLNPFALTAYVGWLVAAAALASRSRWLLLAAIPAVLSLGVGPIYDLPVAELVRFPYRWHAATLALLAVAVGSSADRWRLWWLGPAVALEGLLLSPVEPVIPGAPAEVPALYDRVDGPILEVPGPVALPPGEINRSRSRARYLLYYQASHGQPSPWVPDFNAVGVGRQRPEWLDAVASYDRLENPDGAVQPLDVDAMADIGLRFVMVQRPELGSERARMLGGELVAAGAELVGEDGERWLFALPAR